MRGITGCSYNRYGRNSIAVGRHRKFNAAELYTSTDFSVNALRTFRTGDLP